MGDPSSFRFVPASSSATPIDWSRISEATKKFLIERYGYDWEKQESKPLPATITDLAKFFDGTKFFGYFRSDISKILMDISEFGLQPTPLNGSQWPIGPRFYMKYLKQVWFLLFAPGTRDCIVGYSEDIVRNTNEEEDEDEADEKMAADETAIAQAFDVKLKREVSEGRGETLVVELSEQLGGWTAWTLQSDFEGSQYNEAIMKLPGSHPAYRALMEEMFRSLRDRPYR